MNATRKDIIARIDALSELVGQSLSLETWAPGDGWTRYRLITADHQPAFRSERNYTKSELYEALGLALSVAYAMKEQAN